MAFANMAGCWYDYCITGGCIMELTVAVVGAGRMGSFLGKQLPKELRKIFIDIDKIKEALNIEDFDFTQNVLNQDLLTWVFLDLLGNQLDLSSFTQNHVGVRYYSQTGDVFISYHSSYGSYWLLIDLGPSDHAQWTHDFERSPYARYYHVIVL